MAALGPDLRADLQAAVLRKITHERMIAAAFPTVLVKALATLRKPEFDMAEVARTLESDPVVALRCIRLVNSVALAAAQPAVSILQAVGRLGALRLRTLLLQIAAERVFASQDPAINQACRTLWQHSVAVGLLTRELLAFGAIDDDAAEAGYLGGLLHDIGKPVVAGLLLDAERRLRGKATQHWLNVDEWIEWINEVHRQAGLALAIKWEMPEVVSEAIRSSDQLDEAVPRSVTNFIVLANDLAKREGLYLGPVDLDAISARISAAKALLALPEGAIEQLTSGLRERVAERLT